MDFTSSPNKTRSEAEYPFANIDIREEQTEEVFDEPVRLASEFHISNATLGESHTNTIIEQLDFGVDSSTMEAAMLEQRATNILRSTMDRMSKKRTSKIQPHEIAFMLPEHRRGEKSHHFLCGLIILRQSIVIKLYCAYLVMLLFLERFCFYLLCYKMYCSDYMLILFSSLGNIVYLMYEQYSKGKKVVKKMHHIFEFDDFERPPGIAIAIMGILDMAYSFFLYWPTNLMPILGLTIIYQLFIPFDTFIGLFCCQKPSRKAHIIFSLVILMAGVMSFLGIYFNRQEEDNHESYIVIVTMCIVAQALNALSKHLKEKVVKSLLLNQVEFFLHIAIAQFVTGIMIFFYFADRDRKADLSYEACPYLYNGSRNISYI